MNESDMMHGLEWRGQDITGWLASEKLNGCRAFWDGYEMWSRGGLQIHLPHRIRSGLPTGIALDGEVFAGRESDGLHLACEAVKFDRWDARCCFKVFDAPHAAGGWQTRMHAARAAVGVHAHVSCVPGTVLRSAAHAIQLMEQIHALGGEGIMVRHPSAPCLPGRHSTILKIKRAAQWLRQKHRHAEKIAA